MVQLAVSVLTDVCSYAVPVGAVFHIGYLIVNTFFDFAFNGGRLWSRR